MKQKALPSVIKEKHVFKETKKKARGQWNKNHFPQ